MILIELLSFLNKSKILLFGKLFIMLNKSEYKNRQIKKKTNKLLLIKNVILCLKNSFNYNPYI